MVDVGHHFLKPSILSKFFDLFYPSKCPSCNQKTDSYKYSPFCHNCWGKIIKYTGPSCKICALPVSSKYAIICERCIKRPPPFSKVVSYGLYNSVLAEAINQFKFYSNKKLSKSLAELILELDLPQMDGIIPVPLSKKTLLERGFNQSLLIAKQLSKRLNIPLYSDKLIKIKDTPSQVGLSAKERYSNLNGAFKVKGNVNNLKLFLLDDVFTTGATVTECSKELLKAGAKEIIVIVIARAGEQQ